MPFEVGKKKTKENQTHILQRTKLKAVNHTDDNFIFLQNKKYACITYIRKCSQILIMINFISGCNNSLTRISASRQEKQEGI